ncbi:BadM/Rrf2 family transcriptional regulator [Chromobacterium phragmitis]|uniref:Rrf2 family transcriptional regulator n=1 Tax=Chromobacterium phragmitis TaxID=2202141 RepID=A0A344UG22_9NEIS|nr:Rrf2 family transcriptional regulator [Chromobacterium phragmitis]AXE28861.1 BadM/Rrf2 family transcriptional regulator [Chromobacterium phragmitis]AXE34220.1 BadM/Rrf2 family transcriptional regulator [Chromobacterium phragmitis]
MQLTRFTDLGLRVLMYLTGQPSGQLATIPEIAERFEISRNHLVKVVHFMGQQGWLVTTRGKGGGMSLSRPPEHYRLGEVVRSLEGKTQLIDCAEPPCALNRGCLLKGALDEALEAFFLSLDGYTLRDIVAGPTGEAIIRLHRSSR